MMNVRPLAVAGLFYPAEERPASPWDEDHPAEAKELTVPAQGPHRPRRLYLFSPIAASAYRLLDPLRPDQPGGPAGPVHRVWVKDGLAGRECLRHPLGTIDLDLEAMARLIDLPQVETPAAAHAQEHSPEVHLPFLQTVLGDFKLVPLLWAAPRPKRWRGAGTPLGWRRDPYRREFRSVPLPALTRPAAWTRPRPGPSWTCAPTWWANRPVAPSHQRVVAGRQTSWADGPPAGPAQPGDTAGDRAGWWATAPSPSRRCNEHFHRQRTSAHDPLARGAIAQAIRPDLPAPALA